MEADTVLMAAGTTRMDIGTLGTAANRREMVAMTREMASWR
jgi:hypothetical protein